ncbi:MAG: DUF3530 family protein [Halomonadaceae bacterium]|nr:MAG: DUF3530 family protein [Halomonadaceae bacterium]
MVFNGARKMAADIGKGQKRTMASCGVISPGLRGYWICLWLLLPMAVLAEENGDEKPPQQATEGPRITLAPGIADQSLGERFPEQAILLESGGAPFTALQLRETTPRRQGAALIVADAGESPAAGLAGSLRRYLPAAGWRTLAMALPIDRVEPLPARVFPLADPPGGGNDPDSAPEDRGLAMEVMTREPLDKDTLADYQGQSLERVAAGVAHLRQAGYQNMVLIGIGAGADTVTRFVQQDTQQLPDGGVGLVWLYPQFQAPLNRDLDAVFGREWAIPVLDLVDSRRHREAAAARRAEAGRGRFERYQQQVVPLNNLTSEASQKRVAYRIQAWLEKHMLGMEL